MCPNRAGRSGELSSKTGSLGFATRRLLFAGHLT
jgi:hypothetical protein